MGVRSGGGGGHALGADTQLIFLNHKYKFFTISLGDGFRIDARVSFLYAKRSVAKACSVFLFNVKIIDLSSQSSFPFFPSCSSRLCFAFAVDHL